MKLHEIMKALFSHVVFLLFFVMPSFGSSSLHEKPEIVIAQKDATPSPVVASLSFDVSDVVNKVVQMLPKGVSANAANLMDKVTQLLQKSNYKMTIILLASIGFAIIILFSILVAKIRRWMFLRSLDKESFL